ncbi:MAG: helix-turn-helix transcriptional regulator [Gammaproteobacteria bacterium]
MEERLLRAREVMYMCAISKTTMYRKMAEGKFPRPERKIDKENPDSGVRWKLSTIQNWIEGRDEAYAIIKNGVVSVDLKSGSQQT